MRKRKKASGLDALAFLIRSLINVLWCIITLPYQIYKHFKQKQVVEDVIVAPEMQQASIYKRKYLLTKHEWNFYKNLKPIADKLQLVVLAKVRMADLVETVAETNSEYYRGFGKVKAKHVDFALARPENLYIELLIELDDSSHTPENARDTFVEKVYEMAGYRLLRVRNEFYLEEAIKKALTDQKEEQPSE